MAITLDGVLRCTHDGMGRPNLYCPGEQSHNIYIYINGGNALEEWT